MKKGYFVIGLSVTTILLVILTIMVVYKLWINHTPSIGVHVEGFQGEDAGELQLFAELPQTREQLNKRGVILPTKKIQNGDYKMIISNLPDGTYTLKMSSPHNISAIQQDTYLS